MQARIPLSRWCNSVGLGDQPDEGRADNYTDDRINAHREFVLPCMFGADPGCPHIG